jgi:hypothetical protein
MDSLSDIGHEMLLQNHYFLNVTSTSRPYAETADKITSLDEVRINFTLTINERNETWKEMKPNWQRSLVLNQ